MNVNYNLCIGSETIDDVTETTSMFFYSLCITHSPLPISCVWRKSGEHWLYVNIIKCCISVLHHCCCLYLKLEKTQAELKSTAAPLTSWASPTELERECISLLFKFFCCCFFMISGRYRETENTGKRKDESSNWLPAGIKWNKAVALQWGLILFEFVTVCTASLINYVKWRGIFLPSCNL